MKINRLEFLNSLEFLEAGLSTKPIIEELTFIWFTGTHVYAYNDVIGIVSPLETEFKGGMKGSLLLGLLHKSRAKEIELLPSENEEMFLKAANTRLNLAYYGMDRAIWDVPVFDRDKSFPINEEFIKAISNAMISVGHDTSIPDQLGITLIPDGNILYLFSTDSKTISRAMIPFECSFSERIILPAVFCQQLIKLCKDRPGRMLIEKDSVLVENANGTMLFSRLIETSRPLEFHKTVDTVLSSLETKSQVPIPKRFKLAVERVSIVLESNLGEPAKFQVNNNILQMQATTNLGNIKDSMRLESDHSNVEMFVDPTLVKRALDDCSNFYLVPSCVILSDENFIHLISASER